MSLIGKSNNMRFSFRSKGQVTLLIIILLTLTFIFGQSSLNLEESLKQSDDFEETLNNIFTPPIKNPQTDEKPGDTPGVTPPSDETPSDTPSVTPPSDETPSDTPSVTPPSDETPSDTPSVTPPSDETPSDTPSVTPPSDTPPEENPPVEETPKEEIPEEEIPRRESPFLEFIRPHIRKIAHFLEHGILGLEVFFFCLCMERYGGKKRKIMPIGIKTIISSMSFGLFVAFLDESIQLLSDRGASVRDMWIDISGYFTFTLLLTVIYVIVNLIKCIVKFVFRIGDETPKFNYEKFNY